MDSARLRALNHGVTTTATLMEALAIDIPQLVNHYLTTEITSPPNGITGKMLYIATAINNQHGADALRLLTDHQSDTLRGLGCYLIALQPWSLAYMLTRMKKLANDEHFGVREWAWLALRPHINADIETSLAILTTWSKDESAYIRRFASESTRPRGVWCTHLQALRREPAKALPLLTNLHQDTHRYVQLSVGNWLNDASKDHPTWVRKLCAQWKKNNNLDTLQICKRALRTIVKNTAKTA